MIEYNCMRRQVASIILLYSLLFLFLSDTTYAEAAKTEKTVLIINSYHQGFVWSKDETDGILKGLNNCDTNPSVLVEYMDWKNYPTSENIQFLTNYFTYKYANKKIDLLMATDDVALEFVLKNRESLFSNAPVVFCGVNQSGVNRITQGYKNVTGVLEEVDPTETIKMALEIQPSMKNIYVLFDNSESGTSTGQLVMDKIKSMNADLNTIPLNQLSYNEIKKSVQNLDENSMILITTYYSDGNGKIVDFEEASREISINSSVPVYHLYDLGLNNGAFGGAMLSGKDQGANAAGLALRILNGESPDSIPVMMAPDTQKVFDFQQLSRFNISSGAVPKDCEVINKPFSFFETYKKLVIGAGAAFALLIAFVFFLLFYIRQMRKMKKDLQKGHEELSQIYEELAASDEELRQQFDEISTIQEQLLKSEERFRVATDGSNAVIWDVDLRNMDYHFSDRWYELLGYEKDEIDESHGGWRGIIHPEDLHEADKARTAHLEGTIPFYNCEYRMRRKDGEYIWLNVRGKVLRDYKGRNIRFAGSLIDITERKAYETKLQDSYQELESTYEELMAAQEELKQQYDEILTNNDKIKGTEERLLRLAYHDTLTGLLNKLSLYENAKKRIFLPENGNAAVLFIDMDNFKYINDTMGHAFGDQLIIKVSERLTSLLKEGCSIYRLSGDEFIIIVPNTREKEDAEIFSAHIIAGFKEEFTIQNSIIHVSLSIGIAMYPEHGLVIEELLKNADIAMYRAKETGRNRYVVYNQFMHEAFLERMNIEKHLHTALARNEFEIFYQPQMDLESKKITGFEALLRWNSPELGSVSPLKFIKVAEDTHLIIALGSWVLNNACAFLKKLHKKGYEDLSISVNISILQLLQTDFHELVMDILEIYELEPGCLELEITETVLMESYETIGTTLEKLHELGIRIALDDFGKGYSSLSYLRQLPISTIKIDKSFIDYITQESEDKTLAIQIVLIGKSLGMCVVAEGVEDKDQFDYLCKNGCHKIQGYLLSRPIPEDEIESFLQAH